MDNVGGKKGAVSGYMTVEAALVMSVVLMVYVFLIDTMITQFERCVEEMEQAGCVILGMDEKNTMYDIQELNPVSILRLQRLMKR